MSGYAGGMTDFTAEARRALLIVDVQNDFTEGGALGTEGGSAVAEAITGYVREHTDAYVRVYASRDWHNADSDNGGHFAAPDDEPDYSNTWPVHCVADTEGAAYHSGLDTSLIDLHIRKGMGEPAYSAFEGETESGQTLAQVLRADAVTDLDVVGIATDFCVKASALDALAEGLNVRVLHSLTSAVSEEGRTDALTQLAAAGVDLPAAN